MCVVRFNIELKLLKFFENIKLLKENNRFLKHRFYKLPVGYLSDIRPMPGVPRPSPLYPPHNKKQAIENQPIRF